MAEESKNDQELISRFDELYKEVEVDALYDLMLPYKDTNSDNPDLLWRLAYAFYERAKQLKDKGEKRQLTTDALEIVKKSVELGEDNHNCHKWYGVLLDAMGEFKDNKARIADAYTIKDHFMKGLQIKPNDAELLHCMGMWCYEFASLPWYLKKIASVIFSTPPDSTYEEALKYFEDAEKSKPEFFSPNLLHIAMILLELKRDKNRVKDILLKLANWDVKLKDDKEAKEHATKLLKKEFKISNDQKL